MNLEDMTGKELVATYNQLATARGMPAIKKFENRTVGIRRCQILLDGGIDDLLPPEKELLEVADDAKPSLAQTSRGRRADKVIRVHGPNPRKAGSDGHKYYEAMIGGPTVGEYTAKFPDDRRKAVQWLWNTIRDGYAELLG